jgi:hypothetical protein
VGEEETRYAETVEEVPEEEEGEIENESLQ